jgi:class 3 adenylate cyclase/tetratricopeptide (TPR) repeat protein
LSYTPPYLADKILTTRSALEGERKQVTVLFADIKDSTELIRDLDPEEAQKLLDPAIHIMMEAVHRFEGTVNQVLGDGIMALFGAPIAHEDHAARACYTALAMQAAMQDYTEAVRRSRGLTLRIRVGLNSGEVVVRTIGNDLHMDYSAVGPTTNLASRMEQLADPGRIILTASTLRLVEGLVQVNALGPIPVKGMNEPVAVYELTGTSSIRRRLQAAATRGLTKFVGRDTEIDALHQALEQASSGHGQIVAAVGEAGVGKSRLIYEFVHSHRTQGWLVLESTSVSYGKATPYFPVMDLLKRYVHVEDNDDARTIRAKVTGQIVTLDETLQETIPALLSLLDALPEDSPFLQLDPPQRRQRTLDGLKRILLRESQVQPLVLVFEDLHWIDSETQTLLDSLVESLPSAQLLLLVNYRPEYQHGWGGKTYSQLRLDPLPPASAETFLAALLGDDSSLAPLTPLLIARTQGNPFFLEESVRTLVETGVLVGTPGAYRLVNLVESLQVPVTVQAVLAARIDRLSPEDKRLLQTAAVIGTDVPFALLQAIAEVPEVTLHRGLAHLQAAEFLYETHLFPTLEYTFKHALTHEVAYGSLLHERKRALHAHIVEALEALAPDRVAEQAEQLAHHALRGEAWDKALAYCRQAGEKAMARSAYREAVGYFEQALRALTHLPEQRDTREQAIDLRLELQNVLGRLGEWEAQQRMLDILDEAEVLAEALDDHHRLARVLSYKTVLFSWLGNNDRALSVGQRALALAAACDDVALQIETNAHLGSVYYNLGNYRRAIEVLRATLQSVAFHEDERHQEYAGLPHVPVWSAVWSRVWLVLCLARVGDFTEGHTIGADAIRVAEAANCPADLVQASCGVGALCLYKGDLHQAIPMLKRGLAVCRVRNVEDWLPPLTAGLGYAYALAGRIAEALPLLEQAVERSTMWGGRPFSLYVTWWGETSLLAGRPEEALRLAQQALELTRTRKERGFEAGALQLLGEIYAQDAPPAVEAAESHYQQALALATELGMRPLQAHCHRGLGTLYSQTGQPEQARAALSTAINMYRDMEMTFWLPETKAALAAVESTA